MEGINIKRPNNDGKKTQRRGKKIFRKMMFSNQLNKSKRNTVEGFKQKAKSLVIEKRSKMTKIYSLHLFSSLISFS